MSHNFRKVFANLIALGVLLSCVLLWRFPPETSGFYPKCPVYMWLHLSCPGCGGTRAIASLLHGDLAGALHWNAMIVVLTPFLAAFLGAAYLRAMKDGRFCWPAVPDRWLGVSLALITIFSVVRNLQFS